MIVPANVETGFQLGYSWFNSYVLSGGEDPSYTFENIPAGEYVVGVQTVSYSYAASAFATAEIDLTGIDNVSSAQGLKVVVGNNTVLVKGEKNVPVSVYSASGSLVASGVTNAPILLNGQGLYIVKAGEQASKIVK